MNIQEAIEFLKRYLDEEIYTDECIESHRIAIKEIQKAIPLKPIDNGNWCSKSCPTCGGELSEHHGDGYYSDRICLESCPECRQLLNWD